MWVFWKKSQGLNRNLKKDTASLPAVTEVNGFEPGAHEIHRKSQNIRKVSIYEKSIRLAEEF